MRILCEIFVVGALIYLGWNQSFQDRIDDFRGVKKPQAVAQATPVPRVAAQTPTPSPIEWIRESNRHATLDRPTVNATALAPARTPTSALLDRDHRSPLDPPQHGSPH